MKIINDTPFECRTQRDYADETLAIVDAFTKVVLDVAKGDARLSERDVDGEWPRHDERPELAFVQLRVLGTIRSSDGRPFAQKDVYLRVGETERSLRVFGPRQWRRDGSRLVASPPSAVKSVEMGWRLAFGGRQQMPPGLIGDTGLPGPSVDYSWPHNPGGIGFYIREANAIGQPLPQIEDPESLIAQWDDRPVSSCWAALPVGSNLGLPRVESSDASSTLTSVRQQIYRTGCVAVPPSLRFSGVAPGTMVRLEGFHAKPMEFKIPRAPCAWMIEVGGETHVEQPWLWAVELRPDDNLVLAFYRTLMEVPLVRHLERTVRQIPTRPEPMS